MYIYIYCILLIDWQSRWVWGLRPQFQPSYSAIAKVDATLPLIHGDIPWFTMKQLENIRDDSNIFKHGGFQFLLNYPKAISRICLTWYLAYTWQIQNDISTVRYSFKHICTCDIPKIRWCTTKYAEVCGSMGSWNLTPPILFPGCLKKSHGWSPCPLLKWTYIGVCTLFEPSWPIPSE